MTDRLVEKILPAYPFVQYNDDEYVVAFFDAYNVLAQEYLTKFNQLNLGFWPSEIISGKLLDWIALGIYGIKRERIIIIEFPTLKDHVEEGPLNTIPFNTIPFNTKDVDAYQYQSDFKSAGVYNTIEYNAIAYNQFKEKATTKTQYMSDDFFRRILLWNFYKDDGFQFSIPWLKKRIFRFFRCVMGNGLDYVNRYDFIDPLRKGFSPDLRDYKISVDKGVFTIMINPLAYDMGSNSEHPEWFEFFKICIEQRLVNLPFQYQFNVSPWPVQTQPME